MRNPVEVTRRTFLGRAFIGFLAIWYVAHLAGSSGAMSFITGFFSGSPVVLPNASKPEWFLVKLLMVAGVWMVMEMVLDLFSWIYFFFGPTEKSSE